MTRGLTAGKSGAKSRERVTKVGIFGADEGMNLEKTLDLIGELGLFCKKCFCTARGGSAGGP
jgi:hypothetical protein